MEQLGPVKRAALIVAGAVLGIVFAGAVAAWIAQSRLNEAEPLPPAKGEPAPAPQAGAGPHAAAPRPA
jgi:hypothetical protein